MIKEQQIELSLIEHLKALKYTHRPDITDRNSLEKNFKNKFETLNRVNLSDSERDSVPDGGRPRSSA